MIGWQQIAHAAEGEHIQFTKALKTPAAAQSHFLRNLLKTNADTEFGRAHGFHALSSPQDFQKAVPVTDHVGIEPLLRRALSGEINVITHAPVIACEETGGTSGGAKLIPYTQDSLRAFRSAILPSLFNLTQRRPGIATGLIYAAISPAARQPRNTAGGIPVGLPNDAAYLGHDLLQAFASLLAVSPGVAGLADVQEWRQATRQQLTQSDVLSFVSVWSPTFWMELTRDLEVDRLWPKLDTISCWTHGASAPFARDLKVLFPKVHLEPKGLLSTESPVTIAYGDEDGCLPALNSVFLEFMDESGRCFLVSELTAGQFYQVIITTPGGLYRYNTGDVVRCLVVNAGVPRLVFVGRAGNVSDMVGEKLDETFVINVLETLSVPARLVANATPRPHYELWLQSPLQNAVELIEKRLCQNPQYEYARRMGQLAELVAIVRPDFWTNFETGGRLGVLKPSVLQRLQAMQS
jgi:hypothetical protein